MNLPLVLSYNLPPEREGRLRTLCAIEKVRLRPVKPEEYGKPVGALAGLLPDTGLPQAAIPFQEEMLVLCGFSERALDAFLRGFRKSGMAPVALKAVLTPSNAAWNSTQLCAELRQEHAAMSGNGASPHA